MKGGVVGVGSAERPITQTYPLDLKLPWKSPSSPPSSFSVSDLDLQKSSDAFKQI